MKPGLCFVALIALATGALFVPAGAPPARAALLPSPVTPAPRANAARPATEGQAASRSAPSAVAVPSAGAVPAAGGVRVPPPAPAPPPAAAASQPALRFAPPPQPSPTVFTAPQGRSAREVRSEDRTPQTALDVLGAVRYALAHSPMLLAQRAQIANLDATFQKDRATEYPTLTGELQNQLQRSKNTQGNLAQFGISPQSNFSQNTAQVSSQYNLYNGTAQLAAQQARRNLASARQQLRRDEETVTSDVVNAAYALVADRASVALDANDLRYQQLLLGASRANERVGRIAGVDVLRAQVAVSRSQSALVGAQTTEANAREALGVQIGASPRTAFAIADVIPQPPLPPQNTDALISLAQSTRPDALAARFTLEASKLSDAQVDSDLRPTVQAFGSFGSQVSPTSFVSQQQQIDASNAAALANFQAQQQLFPGVAITPPVLLGPVNRRQPGFYQFGLTSTFQIPLYDYGQRAANHHAARAQITSSDAAYANQLDFVEADVRANLRTTGSDLTQVGLAAQSAALARESARIAQLQYQNGLVSFTDVTQTEQTALSAENDLVTARVNYVVQSIRLRLALGPVDTASAADLRGL